jgi:soluble lytic murein transglycosylase-like protein
MLRVQQFLIPAVLLGCLTVIILTNLVSQPEKAYAAPLSTPVAGPASGLGFLSSINLETITEVPTKPAPKVTPTSKLKSKPKKKSQKQPDNSNNDSNSSGQPDSSSGCSIAASYPEAVRQWCGLIDSHATAQDLDPNLVAAVILEESGGNAQAYSSSGAVGLMQIMPRDGLAASFTCGSRPCFASRPSMSELYDPEYNISYGTNMLGSLYRKHGSLRDALLAYGPANVGYYYADIVMAIYERYK